MKSLFINATLGREDSNERADGDNEFSAGRVVWKLGLDIELRAVAVAIQCGRGVIGPAAKWTRARPTRGQKCHR